MHWRGHLAFKGLAETGEMGECAEEQEEWGLLSLGGHSFIAK